jgi:hypothetical protein
MCYRRAPTPHASQSLVNFVLAERALREVQMNVANVVLGLTFAALTVGTIVVMLTDRRRQ